MRLIFLGTASAFVTDPQNYQSNMLLQTDDGHLLLIDCGADARRSLHAIDYNANDIDSVYISHLHADHAGGLEWLAFSRKFDEHSPGKPGLYLHESLVQPLWEHTLSGGLSSLSDEPANLSAFFDVNAVGDINEFTWHNWRFQLVESRHIASQFACMPSYGLFFNANGHPLFITTDSQFQPELLDQFYRRAELIFQDCETCERPSGVHAHYDQLKTLDPAIKSKMWLYHYNPECLPNALADGFPGFLRPGQVFEF